MPVPAGYNLDNPMAYDPKDPLAGTAAFLDDTKKDVKVTPRPNEKSENAQDKRYINVADVDPNSPQEVNVFHSELMSKPIMSHEVTHVLQDSREPSVKFKNDPAGGPSKMYEYGGVDGLLKARQQGKTIMDYGKEQQAKMVQDYQQLTSNAIAAGDGAKLDKLKTAYEPYIHQLAALPKATIAGKMDDSAQTDVFSRMAMMVNPPKMDTKAPTPGVPAGVAGSYLAPAKSLGGAQVSMNGHPLLGPILASPNADKFINNPPRVLLDSMKSVTGDAKKQLQDSLTRTAAKYAKAGKSIELGPQVKAFLGPDNVRLVQTMGAAGKADKQKVVDPGQWSQVPKL